MESRMKKYYTEKLKDDVRRTKKNEPLYRQIYGAYDEFENLKLPVSENEIDITDLKTTVTSREEYRKMKEYGSITNTNCKVVKEEEEEVKPLKDKKVYNINEMLANIKPENKVQNFQTNSKDYLHTLQTDEEIKTDLEKVKEMYDKLSEEFDNEEEALNMSTGALSLDLLSDLKSDGGTEVMPGFKDADSPKEGETPSNKEEEDKTFYGESFKFNKDDFNEDNFYDGDLEKSKGHYFLKALFVIFLIVIVTGAVLYFLDKYGVINILNH